MTDQLAYPLRFVNGLPVTVPQDSDEEIRQCVAVILAYPEGACLDLPEFGVPDPTFEQNGIDTATVQRVVERWEPRAPVSVTRAVVLSGDLDELRANISRSKGGRGA